MTGSRQDPDRPDARLGIADKAKNAAQEALGKAKASAKNAGENVKGTFKG